MRYLLSQNEERRFLDRLRTSYDLTLLVPPNDRDFPGDLEILSRSAPKGKSSAEPREFIFRAHGFGPLRRLDERIGPEDAVGRAMLKINRDAGVDGQAVDLERTAIITWSRPRWFDADRRWIIPSRLGATRAPFKSLSPEFRRMFRSVERLLRNGGQSINSWDIPNAAGDGDLASTRPRDTRNYMVTVWPEAAQWLEDGLRIYHWDS